MLNKNLQMCNAAQYMFLQYKIIDISRKMYTMRESERSLWNSEDKRNNGYKIIGKGKTRKERKDRNKSIEWKREKPDTDNVERIRRDR
jgi:hypothetical protein